MSDDRCDLLCLDAPWAESIRERLLDEETAFGAAGRARAFSDPTRFTLAAALGEGGELCVCDLAWISGRSQGLVSHHLRTVRALNPRKGRRRPGSGARLRALALDKTGTLTEGRPVVSRVLALGETDEGEALALAAVLERRSDHPLAYAILSAAEERRGPYRR